MLHLHARVHLHEVELARGVQQKLDGAGVAVVHGAHGLDGRNAHSAAQLVGQRRRRRLLDKLLVTTLHGAVALAQGHVVAEVIGEHLHLDVTRAQHELLQVHLVVAERGAGLGAGGLVVRLKVGGVMDLAHALAAAAGGRLDEHRIAHALGELASLLHGIDAAIGTGDGGHAAGLHGLTGGGLVAHALDALGGGADEHQVVVGACAGEVGVFRQEAVAGVDGVGAGDGCRRDDVGHDQVAFRCLGGADAHLLVGILHGIGVLVLGRVHRHGLDAQLLAGAHDAQGHLAAVCDEYFLEHVTAPRRAGWNGARCRTAQYRTRRGRRP